MQRPLDVLGSSQDKKVIIQLKSGSKITGTLRAFDSHINIWLDEAEMDDENNNRCYFVGEHGCEVYTDRPWSCRMYPLETILKLRASHPS